MNKTFTKLRNGVIAAAALSVLYAAPAFAQANLDYKVTSAVNAAGTYTDLGTTGTAITVVNNDDANSAAQNIGFTFNFNGTNFTQFSLNTNGFIKMGSTAISAATTKDIFSATDLNLIGPLSAVDLTGAANQTTNPTEYRIVTTGTAPNRVTTIQFKNVADKQTNIPASGGNPAITIPAQFATINFQIKLYETTNNIEFVYGTWTASPNTAGTQIFSVGLKGSANNDANRAGAVKDDPSKPWSQSTFASTFTFQGNNYYPPLLASNAALPDAGRTFRFVKYAAPANDMAVQAIFTQGKIGKSSGTAQKVRALVKNTGSAAVLNRDVKLNISGSNTFSSTVTIPKIAAGIDTIVEFNGFTPTNLGNNFVEVTVPADGNAANNSTDLNVITTANVDGYATYLATSPIVPEFTTARPGPIGNTPATNTGTYLAKFYATNSVTVSKVRIYIPGTGFNPQLNNVGNTVFASVVDDLGNVVAKSADKVLAASDLDKFVEFTFATPATFQNETFYAGVGVPLTPAASKFTYPLVFDDITYNRPDTYYAAANAGGSAPIDMEDKYNLAIEVELTAPTGVKAELNSHAVSVYPNPSNGQFNVSAKDMKGSNLQLEVRDVQGKVVYSANATKENATIDMKNAAAGVYILKVSTDSEVAVKRLVIE